MIVQPWQYTIKLMAHRPDCRSVLKVEPAQDRARAPPRTGGSMTSTTEWVCAGSRVGGAGDGERYDVKVSLWRGAWHERLTFWVEFQA